MSFQMAQGQQGPRANQVSKGKQQIMTLLGDLSTLSRSGEVVVRTVEDKDMIRWYVSYEKDGEYIGVKGEDLERLIGRLRYLVEVFG
jgi:hypothetical protein